MTYPHRFLRLVASGTLYDVETFSWGLSLAPDFPSDPAPSAVPQGVIDAVVDFHTDASITHAQAKLTMLKLNEIGEDGRYASDADTVLHEFETPVAGAITSYSPAQCATAITLATAKTRGRASKGRFYIPTGKMPASNGLLSTTDQGQIASAATAMLNALHVALPGWRVAVMSNIGTGDSEFVTNVRVGRVVDTMRSRRRNLPEEYYDGVTLAAAAGGA